MIRLLSLLLLLLLIMLSNDSQTKQNKSVKIRRMVKYKHKHRYFVRYNRYSRYLICFRSRFFSFNVSWTENVIYFILTKKIFISIVLIESSKQCYKSVKSIALFCFFRLVHFLFLFFCSCRSRYRSRKKEIKILI